MNHLFTAGAIGRIAMLGNHLPRQCGIATFTTDLSDAIAGEFSMLDCFVVAMNDVGKHSCIPGEFATRSTKATLRRTGAPRSF